MLLLLAIWADRYVSLIYFIFTKVHFFILADYPFWVKFHHLWPQLWVLSRWTIIYDLSCEFCPVEHKHENNGIPSIFRWSGDNKISLCNILIEQGLSLFHSKCIVNVNEFYFLALLLIIESGWCKTNCGRIYMFSLLSLFAKSGNPCN